MGDAVREIIRDLVGDDLDACLTAIKALSGCPDVSPAQPAVRRVVLGSGDIVPLTAAALATGLTASVAFTVGQEERVDGRALAATRRERVKRPGECRIYCSPEVFESLRDAVLDEVEQDARERLLYQDMRDTYAIAGKFGTRVEVCWPGTALRALVESIPGVDLEANAYAAVIPETLLRSVEHLPGFEPSGGDHA